MQNISTFSEANEILNSYIPANPRERTYTLKRMTLLMNFLGNPQNKLKVIHIAGTSGKTSTAYYIASMLTELKFKTGLSVSPHIDEVNERAQINLVPIEEKKYCQLLTRFIGLVEGSKIKPSYFELLIAFAFWIFEKEQVDFAIVEAGLGGLLDGTNVINDRANKISVITDIGLDHVEVLGNSIIKIAKQKAGIIKNNNHVFTHKQDEKILLVIKEICLDRNAKLHIIDTRNEIINLSNLPDFQKRNAQLALAVATEILSEKKKVMFTKKTIIKALSVYIPGRMEVIKLHDKILILDGSHNEQKVAVLVDATKKQFGDKKINLLLSFGKNKISSVNKSLSIFHSLSENVTLTSFVLAQNGIRSSIDLSELSAICNQVGFKYISVVPDASDAFKNLTDSDAEVLVVSGSNYLLNHIRPLVFNGADRY